MIVMIIPFLLIIAILYPPTAFVIVPLVLFICWAVWNVSVYEPKKIKREHFKNRFQPICEKDSFKPVYIEVKDTSCLEK